MKTEARVEALMSKKLRHSSNVRFDDEQFNLVQTAATRKGKSLAEYLRETALKVSTSELSENGDIVATRYERMSMLVLAREAYKSVIELLTDYSEVVEDNHQNEIFEVFLMSIIVLTEQLTTTIRGSENDC